MKFREIVTKIVLIFSSVIGLILLGFIICFINELLKRTPNPYLASGFLPLLIVVIGFTLWRKFLAPSWHYVTHEWKISDYANGVSRIEHFYLLIKKEPILFIKHLFIFLIIILGGIIILIYNPREF